jgi:hypothetical protein
VWRPGSRYIWNVGRSLPSRIRHPPFAEFGISKRGSLLARGARWCMFSTPQDDDYLLSAMRFAAKKSVAAPEGSFQG